MLFCIGSATLHINYISFQLENEGTAPIETGPIHLFNL